jgi:DNA phosphorothioation-dependent restriction protein DptG
MASDPSCVVLNWNVHGLNNPARREVVRNLVTDHRCRIVCLQETKLQAVNDATIANTLGQEFLNSFVVLPSEGTSGGILLACSQDHYTLLQVNIRRYSVTATVKRRADNEICTITGVYGPQGDR